MDELIAAMSIDELEQFKSGYPNNASLQQVIDGYIEIKKTELAKLEAKTKFEAKIAKLAKDLPHPEDIFNVVLKWAKIEVPDTTQPPEIVTITNEDGTTTEQERQATIETWQWVVTTNATSGVTSKSSKANGNGAKRQIVVKRLNDDNTVSVLGTFDSGADFCRQYEIDYTNNSPLRALKSKGYLPFSATDGKAV